MIQLLNEKNIYFNNVIKVINQLYNTQNSGEKKIYKKS